jgi:hypothetical protein
MILIPIFFTEGQLEMERQMPKGGHSLTMMSQMYGHFQFIHIFHKPY